MIHIDCSHPNASHKSGMATVRRQDYSKISSQVNWSSGGVCQGYQDRSKMGGEGALEMLTDNINFPIQLVVHCYF